MTNWGEPQPGDQSYPAMPPVDGQYGAPQYGQPQYGQPTYPQQPYPPHPYQQPYQQYGYPPQPGTNGIGIGGFVCGLVGLILFWVPIIGTILAILGISLGGAGIPAGKRNNSGTGLAIAGLVLGVIAFLLSIIFIIAAVSTN